MGTHAIFEEEKHRQRAVAISAVSETLICCCLQDVRGLNLENTLLEVFRISSGSSLTMT